MKLLLKKNDFRLYNDAICLDFKWFDLEINNPAERISFSNFFEELYHHEAWVVGRMIQLNPFFAFYHKAHMTEKHFESIEATNIIEHYINFMEQVKASNYWFESISLEETITHFHQEITQFVDASTMAFYFTPSFHTKRTLTTSAMLPFIYGFDYLYSIILLKQDQALLFNCFYD